MWMDGYRPDSWCIVRTSGKHTLALVNSLREAGIAAWSPEQIVDKRRPRSRLISKHLAPMLPSFVFADAACIDQIVALDMQPFSRISLFRHIGKVPVVSDRALDALRAMERRPLPRLKHRTWRHGQSVRVPDGAFAGIDGRVEKSNERYTLVMFGGVMKVKIDTFLLIESEVEKMQPTNGAAA